MPHEICAAFRDAGLPLAARLEEMLDEHSSHRTERRGCGFTQATRFLSTYINADADAVDCADLDVFADWPQRETRFLASALIASGWTHGWRLVDRAPRETIAGVGHADVVEALATLTPRIVAIRNRLEYPESRLFVDLFRDLLTRDAPPLPSVAGMREKPPIGSCSQAEEFFFEIAHGRVRRGGSANIVVDAGGAPVMVEKMNLGESYSAIVVAPIRINGVAIPAGSLCALEHGEADGPATPNGHCVALGDIARARFLRLTTLALPPGVRERAFSAQVAAQVRSRMLSPTTTTLGELLAYAQNQLRAAA